MNRLKKIIRHTSFAMYFFATAYILVEVYIIENPVTVLNVIIRYALSLTTGFLFEETLSFLKKKVKIKKNPQEKKWIIWVKCSFLFGAGFLGILLGTFFILIMISVFGLFAHARLIPKFIILCYTLSLIAGFIWGNIMYFLFTKFPRLAHLEMSSQDNSD